MCDRDLCGLQARKCVWQNRDRESTEAHDNSDMDVDGPSESESEDDSERKVADCLQQSRGPQRLGAPVNEATAEQNMAERPPPVESDIMQEQTEENESESRYTAQEWRREIMSSTCKGNEHLLYQ